MPGYREIQARFGSWIDATDENLTAITFQVKHGAVEYMATTGAAPTETSGFLLRDTQGEISTQDLAQLFPHVSGSITRVFFRLVAGSENNTRVSVSWS